MATGLAQVHRGESCLLRLRRPGSRLGGNRGYPSLYLASMSQHQQSIRFSLRRLLAIVVLVAVVGAIYVAIVGPSPMLRLFGGAENMAIVREATRVEAYRVVPPEGTEPMIDDISPLDYKVVAGPMTVPTEMATEMSKALLSPETYGWDYVKACGHPVYGVKLSFFQESERVDVYLCFRCSTLAVVRDDQVFGGEDFDNAEQVFVKAVKALFPDDAEIQAIRDEVD